ncbi:S-locus lectin protein kinase family protein [Hibiscus syriacus]|uniref:S-locus lectin protein kinase family protein n=1 Tax=Hibiscus syriacus TaxID=106335 RepID=A0A6A2XNK0_HIBSY|nr:S-locus lectin protein kinase family protein [Hibiscus syriacus]
MKLSTRWGHYAAYTHDAITSQYDLETSVMNDKRNTLVADSNLHGDVPMLDDVNIRSASPLLLEVEPLGSYQNSAENQAGFYNDSGYTCYPSVFSALEGLESWLMPLKLPYSSENFVYLHRQMLNNHYNDAVKYLRLALQCEPLLSASILPLVQLFLIEAQVNEALRDFEEESDMLPLIGRLVIMHQNGYYSLDSLEMIALHVEATFSDSDTWSKFASCFLKLYQYEEDHLSVVWLKHQFSKQILKSEIVSGMLELSIYKAACAAHSYGEECHYAGLHSFTRGIFANT